MKDKKLQVFVSSTYTDLTEERQAAVEAILSSGNIPAGMELFTAGDESQMTVIERWIDESDVYLLILGGRYGSIESKTGKSYTQLEYEYAIAQNKPLFAVVINDKSKEDRVLTKGIKVIEQEYPHLLKEFRNMVLSNKVVRFWDDTKDIKLAIHETLSDFFYSKDLIGWIRGDNAVNTTILAEEIARLTRENSDLRNKLDGETVQEPLYNSLRYNDLEYLLKSEVANTPNPMSLFDFLMISGDVLIKRMPLNMEMAKPFYQLSHYKMVQIMVGANRFEFTPDGHNFYVKARSVAVLDIPSE